MTFMRVSVTSSPPRLRLPTWVARRLPLLREAAGVAEEELGRRQDQLDVDLSRKRPDGHHVWARLQSSRAKFQAPLWLPDSPYVQRWRRRDQASQPYLAAFDFLAPAAILRSGAWSPSAATTRCCGSGENGSMEEDLGASCSPSKAARIWVETMVAGAPFRCIYKSDASLSPW
jgi:hypothetical protein